MNQHDHEVHDARFRHLIQPNALLQKIAGDCLWTEGPVYFPASDLLVWSDIPNNRMLRWAPGMGVGVFRANSNFSNGNTRDGEGRLVTCEHGRRCVSRTEHDGSVSVLVSHYEGKRLNSPNDVVVDSQGTVWFTDPDYGILSDYEGFRADSEIGGCHVYALARGEREARRVADDFVKPNGLAFSPDETKLYIADSGASHVEDGPRHIRVFDVRDGRLSNGRVFVTMANGIPDGLRLDEHGNVWTSAADGVHCYAPDGTLLGKILLPEAVANLTFGGFNRNRLFITATTSVYSLHVGVRGAGR
ncbi:SMP-30/gluconolactonase/LRE family protein [Paraburkholderia unamae]|uniref:Gluconolactonase n=1 Tax=Paraburkholderia unamae TaxID=219649 RepID=A0ABX5KDA7_9BURK|nr:SMP-30/gluconolactonase/LRE family protein [Paraburkholderia unamae]PVX72822.1 gluconolactonase [Paraburkholderia unamae]CAG9272554.1 Gluconolactonase [Paraburkholderia unamae]